MKTIEMRENGEIEIYRHFLKKKKSLLCDDGFVMAVLVSQYNVTSNDVCIAQIRLTYPKNIISMNHKKCRQINASNQVKSNNSTNITEQFRQYAQLWCFF